MTNQPTTYGSLDFTRGKWVLTPYHRFNGKLNTLKGKFIGNSFEFPPYLSYGYAVRRYFAQRLDLTPRAQELFDSPHGFPLVPFEEIQPFIPDDMNEKLLGYQKEVIQYLYSSPYGSALIGLSPRLGKTVISVASAYALQRTRILVIAPLALLPGWGREIDKWDAGEYRECHGTPPQFERWTITNYDTVVSHPEWFSKVPWDLVIVDESVMVKNRKSLRTTTLTSLLAKTPRKWLLSGSPTTKYSDDLFAQFHLMFPNGYSSYWNWVSEYNTTWTTDYGITITGDRPGVEINREFRDIFIVRHQRDVLPGLPEVIEESRDCLMDPVQAERYDALLRDFTIQLTSEQEIPVKTKIAQLVYLQQLLSHPRNLDPEYPGTSGKLEEFKRILDGEDFATPCLVWVHWQDTGRILHETCRERGWEAGLVNSTIPSSAQKSLIERYQSGELPILILSTSIGKYGLTLGNTQTVIRYDRTWDFDAFLQSQWRVRVIGMTHSPLSITLRTPNSVDRLIEDNLKDKSQSIAQLTNADLLTLLRSIHP